MSKRHLIFNKETMEFRYGSGLCVYSEFFNGGRLLCSDYHASGMPHQPSERNESSPSFSLVMDGQNVCFNWDFVDYNASDDSDGRAHAVITLKHKKLMLSVKVHTLCGENGYYTRYLDIINLGDKSISLTSIAPLAGSLWELIDDVPESLDGYSVMPFQVGYFKDCYWSHEGNFEWQDVPFNTALEFGSKTGKSGNTHPFAAAHSRLLGGYFVCQLEWGANWKFNFFNTSHRAWKQYLKLNFSISPDGIAPMRVIAAGEMISSPKVHFGYTYKDFDGAINGLHEYQRRYLLAKPNGGLQPVCYNHWGFMQHELSESRLMQEIDKAASIGCEVFTVDAGWFGNVGSDWYQSVGYWKAGPRLPNDLHPVFDYARSKGLKCGLWIELEAAGPDSEVRIKHPEWLVHRYGSLVERSLDLAKSEVKAYLESELMRVIEYYKLDLLRLDYNNGYLNEGGFNEVEGYTENNLWKHVETIWEIFDHARAKYPQVIFENCAGGGGRTDFGQMTRFSQTQISDWYLFPRVARIYNGMSMALPPESMITWYGEAMSSQRYGCADSQLHMMVLGVPCISGLAPMGEEANPEYIETLKQYVSVYKDFIRPIHQSVNIFHHTPVIPGLVGRGWCALEFMLPDGSKGYAAVFRLPSAEGDNYTLKFKGVDPMNDYRLTIMPHGKTYKLSGDRLMQPGLELRLDSALTSELILIEKV